MKEGLEWVHAGLLDDLAGEGGHEGLGGCWFKLITGNGEGEVVLLPGGGFYDDMAD